MGGGVGAFFGAGSGGGFAKRPAQLLTLWEGIMVGLDSTGLGLGSLQLSTLPAVSVAALSPFVAASAHESTPSAVSAVVSPHES